MTENKPEDTLIEVLWMIFAFLFGGIVFIPVYALASWVFSPMSPVEANLICATFFIAGGLIFSLLAWRIISPKLTSEQIEAKTEMHAAIASIEAISVIHEEYEQRLKRLQRAQLALADAFVLGWREAHLCDLNLITGLFDEFGEYCGMVYDEPYTPYPD